VAFCRIRKRFYFCPTPIPAHCTTKESVMRANSLFRTKSLTRLLTFRLYSTKFTKARRARCKPQQFEELRQGSNCLKRTQCQKMSMSDQIQPPLCHSRSIALGTNAADHESVADGLKAVLGTDFLDRGFDAVMLEFDHFLAVFADQVLVLRVAVIVLVDGA